MLDQPWISSVQSTKQARYQPVINCTYWTVLGSYNNCNNIQLTPKSIPSEAFDEIHQVVLDRISENIASFFQLGMYGAINTDYTTKMDSMSFNSIQMNTHYKIIHQLVFSFMEQIYCALTTNFPAEITCTSIGVLFCSEYSSEWN